MQHNHIQVEGPGEAVSDLRTQRVKAGSAKGSENISSISASLSLACLPTRDPMAWRRPVFETHLLSRTYKRPLYLCCISGTRQTRHPGHAQRTGRGVRTLETLGTGGVSGGKKSNVLGGCQCPPVATQSHGPDDHGAVRRVTRPTLIRSETLCITRMGHVHTHSARPARRAPHRPAPECTNGGASTMARQVTARNRPHDVHFVYATASGLHNRLRWQVGNEYY